MMELYTVVKCKTEYTGFGIIMEIYKIPEHRKSMYMSDNIYRVVTDFGNKYNLTDSELANNYEAVYVESDPEGRLLTQIKNLNIIKKLYFTEEV